MKIKDDFNWNTYTEDDYERQVFQDIHKQDRMDLLITKYDRDEIGHIRFFDNLHPNWKELYHLVDMLGVDSVYEVGCGSGQHLINLRKLNPTIKLSGCDYSQSQIDLGLKRLQLAQYDFAKDLSVCDMTHPLGGTLQKYEMVYTQAVVMHLSYDRAKKMLSNMCKLSSKYVLMIENTQHHDFPKLISETASEFEVLNNNKYINNAILLKRKLGDVI